MSRQRLGVTALAVFGCIGCSSPYSAHPSAGWQQNALTAGTQSAVLVNADDTHIWILSVDGERKGVPSHGQYQLLPGRHTVRVAYFWTQGYVTWTGNDLADYTFDVKAGDQLSVVCQYTAETRSKGTWKFWIADASNGTVVAAEEAGSIVTREATGEQADPSFRFFFHPARRPGLQP